jgi:16S rRNA (uracil1498-N3)-methyltransferase
MQRFFIPAANIRGNEVNISGAQAHQIARVLRMRPGDQVIVLDNSGWEIDTQLRVVEPNLVQGEVLRRRLNSTEARTKISLFQGVLKSQRFEFVLQKGTEIGVVEFVPLVTERCVMRDLEDAEGKRRRWESIIQESAEQSRRGRKPVLGTATFLRQACEQARQRRGLSLIPWEEERLTSLQAALRADARAAGGGARPPFLINLFIGPEGGFTPNEIDLAQHYGLVPVTLGKRTLRAETAGIVAAASVLYEFGDIG